MQRPVNYFAKKEYIADEQTASAAIPLAFLRKRNYRVITSRAVREFKLKFKLRARHLSRHLSQMSQARLRCFICGGRSPKPNLNRHTMSIESGSDAWCFFVSWCLFEKKNSGSMPRAERVAYGQQGMQHLFSVCSFQFSVAEQIWQMRGPRRWRD